MELIPRILILGLLSPFSPGCPVELVHCTPAALPTKACVAFDVWILPISSASTIAAEPVNADFLAVP